MIFSAEKNDFFGGSRDFFWDLSGGLHPFFLEAAGWKPPPQIFSAEKSRAAAQIFSAEKIHQSWELLLRLDRWKYPADLGGAVRLFGGTALFMRAGRLAFWLADRLAGELAGSEKRYMR